MLKLARTLSASTMNWSGVLTATPIQTPVSKAVSAEELDAGLKKENGDLEGYYTRLALTTNAAALADGARAALAQRLGDGDERRKDGLGENQPLSRRDLRWIDRKSDACGRQSQHGHFQ